MSIEDKKCLIFDFDGTIADTLSLLVEEYNDICHGYGCLPVDIRDTEDLKKLKSQEVLKRYKIGFLKIPFLLIKLRRELRKRIFDVKAFDGVETALMELKNRGFDLYILTSNSKENVEIFLKNNNLLDIFTLVYSSSSVFGKDKSINKLLKAKKLNKKECIYIGDETRDIEAMKRADVSMISVSWGFNSKEALLKLKPDRIIDEPKSLLEIFY